MKGLSSTRNFLVFALYACHRAVPAALPTWAVVAEDPARLLISSITSSWTSCPSFPRATASVPQAFGDSDATRAESRRVHPQLVPRGISSFLVIEKLRSMRTTISRPARATSFSCLSWRCRDFEQAQCRAQRACFCSFGR